MSERSPLVRTSGRHKTVGNVSEDVEMEVEEEKVQAEARREDGDQEVRSGGGVVEGRQDM